MNSKPPPAIKNRAIIHGDDDDQPVMPASAITEPAPAPVDNRPQRQRRRNLGRGAYPGRRQITVYVTDDLFMQVKALSVTSRKTMLEIMEDALTNFVKSYAAQRKFQGAGTSAGISRN